MIQFSTFWWEIQKHLKRDAIFCPFEINDATASAIYLDKDSFDLNHGLTIQVTEIKFTMLEKNAMRLRENKHGKTHSRMFPFKNDAFL